MLYLIAVVAFPLIIGYIYGCNDTDPDSYKGKVYYSMEDGK